ncbi:MAG TPA: hypothetical protein VHF07_02155 [Nitrospiraceae bacterium]|nr:hypothetical protein [Nitrospiraceae bacterium]
MSTINLQQRLQSLHDQIRNGKIIEAMNEFYDAGQRQPADEGIGRQHRT